MQLRTAPSSGFQEYYPYPFPNFKLFWMESQAQARQMMTWHSQRYWNTQYIQKLILCGANQKSSQAGRGQRREDWPTDPHNLWRNPSYSSITECPPSDRREAGNWEQISNKVKENLFSLL